MNSIALGFGLLVVAVVIDVGVAFRNTFVLHENDRAVTRSHHVRAEIESFLGALRDAETGQRGYLLTGNDQYLEPFRGASGRAREGLARLEALTAGDPGQRERLAALAPAVDAKFQELEQAIALRRERGFEAARALVLTDRGKKDMEVIRDVTAAMELAEDRLLQERARESDASYRAAIGSGLLALFLTLGTVGLAYHLIRREFLARSRAEREAQRRGEWLQATLTSIGDAVLVTDARGRVTLMNSVARALTGWKEGGLGREFREVFVILNEHTRRPVESPLDRVLREGVVVGLANHTLLVARDGTETPIDDSGAPILDADGVLHGMVLVFRDISQRKRIEGQARFLAEASAALAALVEPETTLQRMARLAVPSFADWCAVDLADDAGALRRVAVTHTDPGRVELAEELFRRYPPGPGDGGGAGKVFATGQSEIGTDLSDGMLARGARDEEHLRLLVRLGLKSYLCVPLRLAGRTRGVITFATAESGRNFTPDDLAVAEDLAGRTAVALENARLYQELQAADRRKDEFLATLAHELRNHLAPFRNGLQILHMAAGEPQVLVQTRAMMDRQFLHLVRLVDDLLDVSRIGRGKVELRKERVNLETVLRHALEASRPTLEAARHHLEVRSLGEPLFLVADFTRLAQVFSNLLNNAARYTPPGGLVRLSAGREGNEAVIRVGDNGVGIPPDMLAHVFEMFTQVNPERDRAQGGLGIGLALVKRLVLVHGGTVAAHSTGLGKGSEFVVRLPLAPDEVKPFTAPKEDPH